MNRWKNSFSVLSRLIRRKPAVCTPPPLAQAARPRCYNTLRVLRDKPVLRPPPPPTTTRAPARWYHQHTTPRRQDQVVFRSYREWSEDEWDRRLAAAVLLAGGTVIAIYIGNREKAPFTNRSRFIILTTKYERKLGESMFAKLKEKLEPKILPPDDPQSVRVRRISSEIVQAVHRSLATTNDGEGAAAACGGYGDISADLAIKNRDAEAHRGGDEAMADDELQNRVAARTSSLLDGWEVIVVKDDMINAMCGPGGKIVVYTGLLDAFREDAEVATVLGHEVGHAIARHSAEKATTHFWLLIVKIAIFMSTDMSRTDMRDLSNMFELFLSRPFSRRMEMEADHIGLMLLAAAGYDPRVAPGVYDKLGKVGGDSVLQNYFSTHPSSKKRSQSLSQEHVMNKALELYRVFSIGQGIEERSPMDSGSA